MSGVGQLVTSGPLILALPVAAAAGAVTFLSPCCLPLVPGYLSFVTGMAGAGSPAAAAPPGDAPGPVLLDGSSVAVAAPPLAATATAPPRGRIVAGPRRSFSGSPSSSWHTARPSAGSATC